MRMDTEKEQERQLNRKLKGSVKRRKLKYTVKRKKRSRETESNGRK